MYSPSPKDSPAEGALGRLDPEPLWLLAALGKWRRSLSAHSKAQQVLRPNRPPNLYPLARTYIMLSDLEDELRSTLDLPSSGPFPEWVEAFRG